MREIFLYTAFIKYIQIFKESGAGQDSNRAPRYVYPTTIKVRIKKMPEPKESKVSTKEAAVENKTRITPAQLNGISNAFHSLPTIPLCSNNRTLNSYFSSNFMSRIRDIYNLDDDEEERVVIVNKELEGILFRFSFTPC